tara:strand:- start:98 stop:307 length:210 start_codon:yes stop_codon:yes gene_type:complete
MKTFKQFNEEVSDIIKGGVTTFLDKNKNLKLGDFINPDKRDKTIENIKSSGKNVLSKTLSSLGDHLKNK